MKRFGILLVLFLIPLCAPQGISPPENVRAGDTVCDAGSSITIRWDVVDGAAGYRIDRAGEDGEFAPVGEATRLEVESADQSAVNGVPYKYRVVVLDALGAEAISAETEFVTASAQWYNYHMSGVLAAIMLFVAVVLWYIQRARRGDHLFVRRIAGMEAVDEAVGRATEMGRSVMYIPGTGTISEIGTIASMNLLGEIAKKTAQYGTPILVPNRDPVVYTVSREIIKGAYTAAGRPDAYDPNSSYFVAQNALAYASAVCGTMVREKPATNFFMGPFHAESLVLAETGASTGAIQIAGCDMVTQLPFFIVSCDYTLIGEELYAASAYLAREPLLLGALKGQDMAKLVFMLILVLFSIMSLITGQNWGTVLNTDGWNW
jgi:Domain of unknown function (DUF6754)